MRKRGAFGPTKTVTGELRARYIRTSHRSRCPQFRPTG